MSSIDERVVQMRFENQQFERGAKESLSTLDKLKNALSFGKASKNLEELQNQSNRFSLGGIGDALSTVTVSFSNFEIMGLRVLNNIADTAYRTGTRLIKSLSVDNIAAGWKKFEDKTTSVATLISQGYDMSTVDEQLNRLNWFTDETSYNFTDMVSNISKFTATGKGLEESVNAMEGIATWASLSGQNAGTASRAMYQLSQAMGAGVMRREDYRSIQNMSMDTQEFRQAALDAGVALGTLKKNADGTYQSIVKGVGKVESFNINQFANHLTEDAWFTSDVMMEVFGKYGSAVDQLYEYAEKHGVTASEAIKALGDNVDAFGLKAFKSAQEARTFTDVLDSVKDAVSTGWMTTFELIFGNYEEAKELWTDLANELYDVFAEGGNARNEMLGEWKELGGRTKLVEAFWNAWNGVMNIISMVKESFREIFPATTAEQLLNITESVRDLTNRFEHLFKLPDHYEDALKKGLIDENEMSKIEATKKRIDDLSKTLRGVFAILDIVKQGFMAFAQLGVRLVKSLFPVGDSILDITGSFGEWAEGLRDSIIEGNYFGKMVETLGPIVDKVGTVIVWVIDKLKDAFSSIKNFFKPFNETVAESADTVEQKWSPITSVVDFVKKAFERLGEVFKGLQPILKAVGDALGKAWDNIHETIMGLLNGFDMSKGMDIANTGIFGILLLGLNNFIRKAKEAIPGGDIVQSALGTLKDSIKGIADAIKSLAPQAKEDAPSLMELAIAIGIVAGSLFLISQVDTKKLITSVGAIGLLLYALEDVMERLSKLNSNSAVSESNGGGVFGKIFGMFSSKYSSSSSIMKTAGSMIFIAGAVGILAGAAAKLAKIPWTSLVKGLGGVAALLAMVTAVAYAMSNMEGKLVKGAGGLILVAVAIRVLTSSVAKLAEMDVDKMTNGLIGVGALLLELGLFSKFAGSINLRTGVAIIAIAASLLIIAKAVKAFGNMDTVQELPQGLSAIAAILAGFVVFSQTVKSDGIMKAAVAMLIMSASLMIIGKAIKSLGSLDEESITRGSGGLAGALLGIALAATVLASIKGTGKASVSILLISGALLILAGAFKVMASIPVNSLLKVLLGFAGALVVIGVAAAILSPLTLSILGLSAALLGISAGILLAGMGLTALSAGIMALGASLLVAGPMLVNGIATTILAVLNACWVLIPKFIEVGLSIILNLMIGIYNKLPEIGTMAVLIVLKFLLTISQLLPLIIMVGIQMIVSFINGMALAIRDNSESIMMAVANLMSSIVYLVLTGVQMIAEQIPIIGGWVSDGIQGIKDSIDDTFSEEEMAAITERGMSGAAKGMEAAEADAAAAAGGYGDASVEGFMEKLPDFVGAAGDMGTAGADELLSYLGDYNDAGYDLAADAVSGADSADLLAQMSGNGDNYANGFINAINYREYDSELAGYKIAKAAVRGSKEALQEKSPSKVMFKVGSFATQGLINGMDSLKGDTEDTAFSVGKSATDAMSSVMSNLSTILNSDMDLNPTITPVLDLSEIQNGTNSLNGMFGNRSFSLASANGIRFEANRLEAMNKLETASTNADVVAALGLLRGDVNNLNDSMGGLQVVMDSGQLVGAISRPMDNALGRQNMYKKRGI